MDGPQMAPDDFLDSACWDWGLPASSGGETSAAAARAHAHQAALASQACDDNCDDDDHESCQSQCGETGHGVCCDDDACVDTNLCLDEQCHGASNPCTDTHCLPEPVSAPAPAQAPGPFHPPSNAPGITEDEAAFTLTSFGGNQAGDYLSQHLYHPHSPGHEQSQPNQMDFGLAGDDYANMSWNYPLNSFDCVNYISMPYELELAAHILQYHGPDGQAEDHQRPCIADNPSQLMQYCSLPRCADGAMAPRDSFAHEYHDHACGFTVEEPIAFARHVWQEHRSALMPHTFLTSPDQQAQMQSNMNGFITNMPSTSESAHKTCLSLNHRLSTSASPRTSISQATTIPATPTSVTTPLSLEPDSGTPGSLAHKRVRDETPQHEQKPQIMACDDQYQCRWMHDANRKCGQVFQSHKELHNHCQTEHLKDLKRSVIGFKCAWHGCPRETGFGQKSKLDRHLYTHTGYKPVECGICFERLSGKQALEQHMRTHTGDKPYKCSHPGCNQAFAQKSACIMHTRTHTGEKPLECEICGKTFAESSNLSKHRRIHNTTGQHSCKLCGKDFHRLDQLRRHMASNHKNSPEKVAELLRKVQRGRTTKNKKVPATKTFQEYSEFPSIEPQYGIDTMSAYEDITPFDIEASNNNNNNNNNNNSSSSSSSSNNNNYNNNNNNNSMSVNFFG